MWAKLVPVLLADIQAEATQRMRAGKPAPKAAGASRAAPSREIVAARVGAGRPTVDAIVHAMKAAPDLLRDLQEGKVTIAQAKATLRKPPERPKKPAVDKSVPAEAVEAIGAAGKFKDLATRIRSIRREVEELALTKEGVELNLILNRVTGALDTAAGSIKFAAPYVPCPFFPNCETGTCKMCRGKKWITRTLHSTLSPQMKEDSLAMIGKPSDSQ
ncbi:MAG TPA: hypothetical protein VEB22_09960 [Phycisphaerales bacterium]|nr:hypothetical protein [Phycisphaerales bacterium]